MVDMRLESGVKNVGIEVVKEKGWG